jgi:hypothetical protein
LGVDGEVQRRRTGIAVRAIILGGQTYTATVQDDLSWSLPLTESQLTALGNGIITRHGINTQARQLGVDGEVQRRRTGIAVRVGDAGRNPDREGL